MSESSTEGATAEALKTSEHTLVLDEIPGEEESSRAASSRSEGWFASLPSILYRLGMLFTVSMVAWNAYKYLTDTQSLMGGSGRAPGAQTAAHREALVSAGVEMQRPSALQALFGTDPSVEIPRFPDIDAATGRPITAHRPVWPSKGRFDMYMYASPDPSFSAAPKEIAQLVSNMSCMYTCICLRSICVLHNSIIHFYSCGASAGCPSMSGGRRPLTPTLPPCSATSAWTCDRSDTHTPATAQH